MAGEVWGAGRGACCDAGQPPKDCFVTDKCSPVLETHLGVGTALLRCRAASARCRNGWREDTLEGDHRGVAGTCSVILTMPCMKGILELSFIIMHPEEKIIFGEHTTQAVVQSDFRTDL